jgi:hypothetical protein
LGQRRGLKKPRAREEENKNALLGYVWVHPQNGLNGLILNWCTGGCWFTQAMFLAQVISQLSAKLQFPSRASGLISP